MQQQIEQPRLSQEREIVIPLREQVLVVTDASGEVVSAQPKMDEADGQPRL